MFEIPRGPIEETRFINIMLSPGPDGQMKVTAKELKDVSQYCAEIQGNGKRSDSDSSKSVPSSNHPGLQAFIEAEIAGVCHAARTSTGQVFEDGDDAGDDIFSRDRVETPLEIAVDNSVRNKMFAMELEQRPDIVSESETTSSTSKIIDSETEFDLEELEEFETALSAGSSSALIRSTIALARASSLKSCTDKAMGGYYSPVVSDPIEKKLDKCLKQLSVKTVLKSINTEFSTLKFEKSCDLGTCCDCASLTDRIIAFEQKLKSSNMVLTVAEQNEYANIKAEQALHTMEHKSERAAFAARVERVDLNPSKYMMLYYDYTKSVFLPKYIRGTKVQLEHQQLEVKICAVIVYANGRRYNYIFIHDATLPKGPDTMLTILYSIIKFHKSFGDAQTADTLYLQCDGGTENISFTPFAFHDFMIRQGIFRQIELYRLPVGHTHGLVDAFLSLCSLCYSKGMMTTIAGLIERMNTSWGTGNPHDPGIFANVFNNFIRPQFVYLDSTLDFTTLLRHHMNHIANIKKRIYGWLFVRSSDIPDRHGFYDVNLWFKVTPAMDDANMRDWRGSHGKQKNSLTEIVQPLKVFNTEYLDSLPADQDPRRLAPGVVKYDREFLCRRPENTADVSVFLLIFVLLIRCIHTLRMFINANTYCHYIRDSSS